MKALLFSYCAFVLYKYIAYLTTRKHHQVKCYISCVSFICKNAP